MPGHWEFGYFDPGLVVETPAPPAGTIPIGRTLHTWGSLPWGVGVWLGGTAIIPAPVAVRVSDDADFLEGLNALVAVEIDVNADGRITDSEGDRLEDWDPVTGLDALACRLVMRHPKTMPIGDRPAALMEWKILLGQGIELDQRYRLVYVDPRGVTRYGYVQGTTVNAHEMDHHWIINALEYKI